MMIIILRPIELFELVIINRFPESAQRMIVLHQALAWSKEPPRALLSSDRIILNKTTNLRILSVFQNWRLHP